MDPATIEIIVTALVGLATTVLTVIVAPLLLKQAKIADGKLSEQDRARLYPVLLSAIAWAQAKVTADKPGQDAAVASIQDSIVTQAAYYVRLHMGDTLDSLDVTDEALRRMLLARLQQAIAFARATVPGLSDVQAALFGMPATTTPVSTEAKA